MGFYSLEESKVFAVYLNFSNKFPVDSPNWLSHTSDEHMVITVGDTENYELLVVGQAFIYFVFIRLELLYWNNIFGHGCESRHQQSCNIWPKYWLWKLVPWSAFVLMSMPEEVWLLLAVSESPEHWWLLPTIRLTGQWPRSITLRVAELLCFLPLWNNATYRWLWNR